MNSKNKHLLETHFAALLFGLTGLFAKFIKQNSIVLVFGRVFFASLSLFFYLLLRKSSFKLNNKKDYLIVALLGVLLTVHWVTFFQSIQFSNVSIGLLSFSIFPIITAFIEPLFFNEKLKKSNFILAVIVLFGVYLIVPKFSVNNIATQGIIIGMISAFVYAFISAINKRITKNNSAYLISFYQEFVASIILLPFMFYYKPKLSSNDLLLLALLGVLFTSVAHTIFINSMKYLKLQTTSIINCMETPYGIILSVIFLKEVLTLNIIIGGVLIIGAGIYVSYQEKSIIK